MVQSQDLGSSISFTIAGLARAGGVGVETVRYYQRRGLMETPKRPSSDHPDGGARRYTEKDIRTLQFIKLAQAAGFTLEQIGELLYLDATEDRTRVRQLAKERISALEAKIAGLQEAKNALSNLAHACETESYGPCPILTAFDVQGSHA